MPKTPRYWFPAKRYGWGWGPPATWEGWAVVAGYILLTILSIAQFPPAAAPLAFVACLVGLSLLLVAVCWLTGEPPRWRWGGED